MIFEENSEGVHIMNPINAEYTLCGVSFDNDENDIVEATSSRVVTCVNCIEIIKECRNVKYAECVKMVALLTSHSFRCFNPIFNVRIWQTFISSRTRR